MTAVVLRAHPSLSRLPFPSLSSPYQSIPQPRHHGVQSKGVTQARLSRLALVAQRRIQEMFSPAKKREGKKERVKSHTMTDLRSRRAISFCLYKRDGEYDWLTTSSLASFFNALILPSKRGTISAVAFPLGHKTSRTGLCRKRRVFLRLRQVCAHPAGANAFDRVGGAIQTLWPRPHRSPNSSSDLPASPASARHTAATSRKNHGTLTQSFLGGPT